MAQTYQYLTPTSPDAQALAPPLEDILSLADAWAGHVDAPVKCIHMAEQAEPDSATLRMLSTLAVATEMACDPCSEGIVGEVYTMQRSLTATPVEEGRD